MSTDKAKLKALAEAAQNVKLGRWFVHRDGLGPGFDPHPHQNFGVDDGQGCVVVWHGVGRSGGIPYEEVAAFISAAKPAAVLALIAENESLRGSCKAMSAENAGLKTGYEAYEQVNAELKAEVEALRKVAADAREFLMHEAEVRGFLDESDKVSYRHPKRKALIDSIHAAMSKEAQA